VKELLALVQTCHAMKDMVTVYLAFAFSFPKLTQAFILYEDVVSFRRMLQITGGIISGSMALAFLDRVTFDQSDMDIYIPSDKLVIAEQWLLQHGAVKAAPKESTGVSHDYDGIDEVGGVESFIVERTSRIIQLVLTKRSPVYAVLVFHSCKLL
jgi:hypothetical protein